MIVRVALLALWRNLTRSILTTLGIVIGVGAVIAMVAIGEGAKKQVEEQFASMGTNLIILLPGSSSTGGAFGGSGSKSTLTFLDLKAVLALPAVRAAAPVLRSGTQVQSESQNWSSTVNGTTPAYFDVRNWPVDHGRLFNDADVDGGAKVALLGKTVVDKLYGPGVDAVGQSIRMKGVPFDVIGVLSPKGQSPTGQDLDDCVILPVTTFQAKVSGQNPRLIQGPIMISARESTARAIKQISELLRDRHHLEDKKDDFSAHDLTEIANAQQAGTQTLTILLFSIALVSLVVGGIGIMNIMLVSVTERTREIGIRMAVGATPLNVLAQFLVEAVVLSVLGGLLGTALGVGASELVSAKLGWPILIRSDVIVLAVAFSGFVGVAFGIYPARRASQLDPIDALRFE